jgi:hypothetical protein
MVCAMDTTTPHHPSEADRRATPGVRLAAYGAGLAVVFAGALGLGSLVGPIDDDDEDATHADHGADDDVVTVTAPGGLQATAEGFTLELLTPSLPAAAPAPIRFRILDATGTPVVAFDELHERQLHLIVVDRQLGAFQHVHPTLTADGVWSTDLVLDPGTYRVFTDIAPTALGHALTLGTDLVVPGDVAVAEPPGRPRPRRSTATRSSSRGRSSTARRARSRSPSPTTASRSPTSIPTSAPMATSSPSVPVTSPTCTCTRPGSRATAAQPRAPTSGSA